MSEHDHKYVFLREDKVPITTWGDRVGKWEYFDIYFCEGCLTYQRIKVKETVPSREWMGREDTVWRLQ